MALMPESAHSLVLRRAAQELGGDQLLCEHLRVSRAQLEAWMDGAGKPPTQVFLQALDIGMARLRRMHRYCETVRSAARRALAEAQRVRDLLAADMLGATLDGALRATGADMGNVQVLCAEGLRIVAQRGFERPFLDFYAVVDDCSAALCGMAGKLRRRIVVADVASDPIFAGTPAEPVMAQAAVRAVQSTPLLNLDGKLLGVLSTHYASPHCLTPPEEESLDRMARQAVPWLGLQPPPMGAQLLGSASR